MKKKLLTFTVCAALTASICAGGYLNKGRYLKPAFLDIRESYMTQTEMPLDNISDSISKINQKYEGGKRLTLEEEFILAYDSFANGKYEETMEKTKTINESITKNTDGFVKVYNTNILIQLLLANEEYDECINVFNNMFNNLSNKEKEKFLQEIILMLDIIKYTTPSNVLRTIEVFEDIIENNHIDEMDSIRIKSKLSILYIFNGNYARSMEKSYEIISHSESKELTDENEVEYNNIKYYESLAKSDLALVNGMLGNYEEGKEWFLKCLDLRIDEELNATSYMNALYNLHTTYLMLGEFDSAFKLHDEINRLAEFLSAEEKEEVLNYSHTLLAQYYLEIGDIEQSEVLINKTKEILESGGKLNTDYYPPYNITLAEIYSNTEHNYKKGEELTLELLELNIQNRSYEDVKKCLRILIDLYNNTHDYEKMFEYTNQLKETYKQATHSINEDYAEYAVYKYNNQKLLTEEYEKKIKTYVTSTIVIMLSILSAIITYLKYKELIKASRRDVLTKCYNRRYFDIQYNALINKKKPFALILFDIDNFKKINDTYGHAVGDVVLIGIVEHINSRFDGKINLFRYGGEEFAILLEKSSKESMFNQAEIIRNAIENIIWKYGFKVTISMGAFFTDGDDTDIFEKADKNLYISKNTGKNKVTI